MIRRRDFLLAALPFGAAALAGRAGASELPPKRLPVQAQSVTNPQLLLGGDRGSPAGRWGSVLAPELERAFGHGQVVSTRMTVGQDGVTAANLFDTQTPPDGTTALAVPGAALVAALSGAPRIHFDYTRWLPLFFSLLSPVVIGRAQLHHNLENFMRDRPVRIAVSTLTGIELPTVLGMTLFGLRPIPVPGLASVTDAITALRDNQVDVIQILDPQGSPETRTAIEALSRDGYRALFTLTDSVAIEVGGQHVPCMRDVLMRENHSALSTLLYAAWTALAGAASLDIGLVLPMLTPPPLVAEWRHATDLAIDGTDIRAMASGTGRQLLDAEACAAPYRQMAGDVTSIMALRRWLSTHLPDWRMG
ncbi:hypothetical protein CFR73_00470 [Novacetimonas maltaceti]|uniref:hypothetical protein n=2 Tax=Novacetimonas maltaceti TaxID=1203393 RepID=UPI000D9C39BF|nr:hypothetical protein [Novacetimonas maltaceti]PYD62095.1 hypothetical protein CFR73_00470 [Novacetimonas maltaceti]